MAKESDEMGIPSIRTATPDTMPTAAWFEILEMPRIPIGARELVVPLRETEGTNLFKSEILETLEVSSVDAPTTAADTVTSDNLSVRFCAVITISPISDSALAPGAV
jgi:hypothetical protein